MVIIGLLLIALVCLTLGLILQSAIWLIASLIATGGAAFLLYKLRHVIGMPKSAQRPVPPELPDDAANEAAVPPRTAATPRAGLDEADVDEAGTDDQAPGAVDTDAEADTGADLPVADADLPVAEDDLPVADDDLPVADDEVWVIEGLPRYHLGNCAILKGQDAEPISYDQATEDGFMPCSLCEPHAARTR